MIMALNQILLFTYLLLTMSRR